MQIDIDQESANKIVLTQQLQEADSHSARSTIRLAITKANDKIEALMLLLLQYCAGLQHCLDQEEEQRQLASSSATAATATTTTTATATAVNTTTTTTAVLPDKSSATALADAGISRTEKEGKAEARADERQTEEDVAQVLTELIHTAEGGDDDDSSSEEEGEANGSDNREEGVMVEQFRPVHQEGQAADEGRSKAAILKAKATLEGCCEGGVDSDEGRELENSTSL